ncbi:hypothetical protein [uncultured Microbacterium sp.]|uniref:hypothetical protein n=1 Tax=uncultured Microbacterium sp. TaxID=191216 RepID=UPI0035C9B720
MSTSEPLGGGQQDPSPQYPQPPVYQQPAYQQPAYGAPTQTLPPAPPPTPKKALNVVGLISLITAGIGFIFACIPGALIVGWILLPIGFILGIVSLFLAGKGKGLGIAGLIVSIVGTIVAFVVFFAVAAAAFSAAVSDDTNIGAQPSQPADAPAAEQPAAAAGTRDNPIPLGTSVSSADWTVVVNSVNQDGNATVTAGNSFNEAPPAGSHYIIVNWTNTYIGTKSGYAAEVQVDVVTASGNVVDSYDNIVILEDSFGLDELFPGGSVTGSAAYLVADNEPFLVRAQPGFIADEVFYTP